MDISKSSFRETAQDAIARYEDGSLDLYNFTSVLEDSVFLSEATADHVAADFRAIWGAIETVNAMQLYDLEKGRTLTNERIQEDRSLVKNSIGEIKELLGLI
ncbi:Uncharacterised protein [Mycobacteroides abscessus subsp. abscessus]|uniref:hypothetical protein n=1 Tax=Mycobacteroides abscessus TaxID=36809 RepID=UPI00046C9974|nr:hypothetical protein [Mycobacteroides abscessus]MDO3068537.1 hypothetical protein [Mycobacteroides abscessus subsp. bolletii]SID83356.1 Uncharacterised protein [Mycobacteroides abscessus subsp. abscessus]SKN59645.1 Uncharacterised protein [Mycobacteroides abscessus subsp. bolletii]SKV00238.1 Uncharacterised protein [Mycobacteroides abscessus subsp. abscessus]SKX23776.1 Uncharacterised protein [Mycobacteroides abscessus subsp. bolletii]